MSISQHESAVTKVYNELLLGADEGQVPGYLFTWPDGCIADKWFTAAAAQPGFVFAVPFCSSSAHILSNGSFRLVHTEV